LQALALKWQTDKEKGGEILIYKTAFHFPGVAGALTAFRTAFWSQREGAAAKAGEQCKKSGPEVERKQISPAY